MSVACSLRRAAVRSILLVAVLLTQPPAPAAFAGKPDPPPATGVPATTPPPVTLTINPDGTAVWHGEPLASVPDLENKLARQTEQDPKLQLDLRFHTVGQLGDSNRQTLLDVLELAAQFGYVHVQSTTDGAPGRDELGPGAVELAPK